MPAAEPGVIMIRSLSRMAMLAALLSSLGGCAVDIENAPINVPMSPPPSEPAPRPPSPRADETLAVGVAFSGGGTRAAAFSFGVLKQIAATEVPVQTGGPTLLDHLDFISGVSGGSITAAYFGYRGPDALSDFREKFLVQDLEGSLYTSITLGNLLRALAGGVNDRRGVQTWLDEHLFHGATFADLGAPDKPTIWLNASDIYNGTPFVFDHQTFHALCSDLSKLPISEAVAASAAVPIAFAPIVMQSFPESCTYVLPPWAAKALSDPSAPANLQAYATALRNYHDPDVMKYVKLLDGGIIDNYGLAGLVLRREQSALPYAPYTPEQGVRLRHLLFVVVDAGQSFDAKWVKTVQGPTGIQVAEATTTTMMNTAKRASFDLFNDTMNKWQAQLVAWRCSLPKDEVLRLRGSLDGWDCRDLHFHIVRLSFESLPPAEGAPLARLPTTLALPADQVDALIKGGEDALKDSPEFQDFLRGVGAPQIAAGSVPGAQPMLR